MNRKNADSLKTQHAFLVVWGWFASHIGLLQKIQSVDLPQKTYRHSPQSKVMEFLVAILAGLKYLQDISRSAYPLDQDRAVAQAWGQPGWAHYTGISRALRRLSWEDTRRLVAVLEQVNQSYIRSELDRLCSQGPRLHLDADLTGLPVSDTSRTYPNVTLGYMQDEIRLGYQAGVISMESPTYQRLWLSVLHRAGDTISCSQATALILEAEKQLGRHPLRRTDLLQKRIQAYQQTMLATWERMQVQRRTVERLQVRLHPTAQQAQRGRLEEAAMEQAYLAAGRAERPNSQLAQARQRRLSAEGQLQKQEQALQRAQSCLQKTQCVWQGKESYLSTLQARLAQFELENQTNLAPLQAEIRLDAGFGTCENMALLIEMGYEVYTKPYTNSIIGYLKHQTSPQTPWTRVGANAEMTAWMQICFPHCPYPLHAGLIRYRLGASEKFSGLWHFGSDAVMESLATWFEHYNRRQTIEAGIKESKQVFHLERIKVRSEPAIYLQEWLVVFAANFIRWASRWLEETAQPGEHSLDVHGLSVKRQVQVAAHVSAEVIQITDGRLLKFSEGCLFAGQMLKLKGKFDAAPNKKNVPILGRFLRIRF